MITAPAANVNRAVWRAVLEAGAQFTPVTAALARLYQTTHPSQFEQDLGQWRADVSAAANDHAARLAALERAGEPAMILSDNALALAAWLSASSPTGLTDPVMFDDIVAAFPDAAARDLQDAAAELAMYGLAEVTAAFGYPVRIVTPSDMLFALFDPATLGTVPQSDAVALARIALELDSGHAPELETHTGWPRRRFNPAFALLLTLVDPRSVRQVLQPDYPSLGFAMGSDERVRFKRLVAFADRGRPPP